MPRAVGRILPGKEKKRVGKYIHRNTAINKLVTQEQATANAYSPQHRCKQIHSTFTLRARSSLKNRQSQQTFRRSLKPLMQLRKQFSDRRKNKLGGRTPTRGPRAPLPKTWKRRACQRISPRRRARISAPCTPCDRLPCPRQSGPSPLLASTAHLPVTCRRGLSQTAWHRCKRHVCWQITAL